jgi:hypothetical protein
VAIAVNPVGHGLSGIGPGRDILVFGGLLPNLPKVFIKTGSVYPYPASLKFTSPTRQSD